MMDFIAEVFGLLLRLMVPARRFYWQVVFNALLVAAGIVAMEVFFNWIGIEGINLLILLFLLFAILAIATRPEIILITLAGGAASGAYQSPQTIPEELRRFLEGSLKFVGSVILWVSVISFFLGTFSIQENPKAILVIIPALIIIGLISKSTGWSEWIIIRYAIIMLIIAIGSLVPGAVYQKVFGFNPKGSSIASEKERTVANIEEGLKKIEDKKGLLELQKILEKVDEGKELSPKEKEALKKYQKERDKNTLPGIAGKGISKIKGIIPQTPSSPSALPPITVIEKTSRWGLCYKNACDEVELSITGTGQAITIARFEKNTISSSLTFVGDRSPDSEHKYNGVWSQPSEKIKAPFSSESGDFEISFNSAMEKAEMKITALEETFNLLMTKKK